jgi:exopolysaccharide biosynthesis protein
MKNLESIEADLKKQLADLANQIRATESSLLLTKEGSLKVSGALEVIEILKQSEKEEAVLSDYVLEG